MDNIPAICPKCGCERNFDEEDWLHQTRKQYPDTTKLEICPACLHICDRCTECGSLIPYGEGYILLERSGDGRILAFHICSLCQEDAYVLCEHCGNAVSPKDIYSTNNEKGQIEDVCIFCITLNGYDVCEKCGYYTHPGYLTIKPNGAVYCGDCKDIDQHASSTDPIEDEEEMRL